MRRLGLLAVASLAMLALVAIVAATAMALPEDLPTSTTERIWTGEIDEAKPLFFTEAAPKEPLECEGAKAEGTEEAGRPLGLFHLHFVNCILGASACTGLGETEKGAVLILGAWHLVWDQLTPELNSAILLLNNEVHMECGTLIKLLAGSLLCLHLEDMVSSTTHLFHCKQMEGKPQDLHWWNDEGKEQTASLKCVSGDLITTGCGPLSLGKLVYGVAVSSDL